MERDLRNRTYDQMNHDEILNEHAKLYATMSPDERVKQTEEREATLARTSAAQKPRLKWKSTIFVNIIVILGLCTFGFISGGLPSIAVIVLLACWILVTLGMEATELICSRLDRIAAAEEQSDEKF